ncbi:MAG: hypothetical protein IIB36_03720 [Gemmatimonadetes bacterium]|nr:hypothetical protein [Gemmatimonadota bacterium]
MQIRQAGLVAVMALATLPFAARAQERFVTIERFVPHTSTVPANTASTVWG